ncbi:MAG TPA: protein O-GlcNAcase, partial [Bacillales bacterium]|nr:protein O-GlcNAcase [Bacillales bacterium]
MDSSPFQVRGVIEGFYGVYYTPFERDDLIRFIGEQGYNLYIYGPKNDRQHRARWREDYPKTIMDQFMNTVKTAKEADVEFSYSIGSGVSMNYASEKDLAIIKRKFLAFYEIGVKTFSILLDDISSEFRYQEEKDKFRSYAEAHTEVSNQLYEWLQDLDPSTKLMMCPTDYHGTAPYSSYIHELGEGLHPDIDVFYTGPDVCTPEIPIDATESFAKAIKRHPVIWDNFPVNDLAMQPEMHIGPITGRDASLHKCSKGIVVNTMIQAEASKIPLLTFADYFHDPEGYQPWESWEHALKAIGGEESFSSIMRFAENSLQSCLNQPNAVMLKQLVDQALEALKSGESVS